MSNPSAAQLDLVVTPGATELPWALKIRTDWQTSGTVQLVALSGNPDSEPETLLSLAFSPSFVAVEFGSVALNGAPLVGTVPSPANLGSAWSLLTGTVPLPPAAETLDSSTPNLLRLDLIVTPASSGGLLEAMFDASMPFSVVGA